MPKLPKLAARTTVAFGDVVRQIRDQVDPEQSGLERYVAGEHMDTDDLRLRRWGDIGDGYLGPAFHMRFKPGNVLYGSRRTYLRKVALADFEGITANTTYVLESKDPNLLLPELLPFIMQTAAFNEHAVRESKGSVNPYVNFSDLAWYEFALPSIEEQRRLARGLKAVEATLDTMGILRRTADSTRSVVLNELANTAVKWETMRVSQLCLPGAPLCYGVVQPGNDSPTGVPMLRVCDIEERRVNHLVLKRVSREIHEEYRRSRIQPNDVLISVVGTIGRVYLVTDLEAGFNIARAIARIRTNEACLPSFLVLLLQSPHFQRILTGEAFETARKTLNLETLGEIEIPLPSIAIQREWSERIKTFGTVDDDIQVRLDSIRRLKSKMLATVARGVAE